MPTRSELIDDLREEIEYLNESLRESRERHSVEVADLTDALYDNTYKQFDPVDLNSASLESALDRNTKAAKGVEDAILTLLGGLLIGGLVVEVVKAIVKRVREVNKKTSMIRSIQFLQDKHPYLTYNFIVERSSADRANKDERQTILNELIEDGIVTDVRGGRRNSLEIRDDNTKLADYWQWLDEIRGEVEAKLKT